MGNKVKYIVVSVIFLVFSFVIINFVGTEKVAHNLLLSVIALYVLVESIDQLVSRTLFKEN